MEQGIDVSGGKIGKCNYAGSRRQHSRQEDGKEPGLMPMGESVIRRFGDKDVRGGA